MKKVSIKKEFANDSISRDAGEKLRNLIEKSCDKNGKIELDFSETIIASTSFFDEGIAKLALNGWDQKKFESCVTIKNLNSNDHKVLDKMARYRGLFV